MTKANITQYDSTPSNNADINDINIAENCPASNINNAIRELMAHLKNVDTGTQALTALSVTGDLTVTGDIVSNTAGTSNFRAGVNAGDAIVSGGNYNTVVGDEAGTAITTGDSNVAVGFEALKVNTTASGNNAIGSQSLKANTDGASNIAIGQQAMFANTTGSNNTVIGHVALGTNTSGSNNVAVGDLALNANTTASNNTAVGSLSLDANTEGASNVGVGRASLTTNTTGSNNVGIGVSALEAVSTGSSNVAVGNNSLVSATGSNNTVIGHGSGSSITSGTKNTIVGSYNGNQSSLDIRTASNYVVLSDGDGNIASYRIGNSGGRQWHFVGDADSDVGFVMKNQTSANPYGLAIQFTNEANNDGNQYFLACTDSSATRLIISNNGNVTNQNNSYGQISDQKFKENITNAKSQWNDIKSLQVRNFNFIGEDLTQIGVIAQELESAGMNGLVEEAVDRDEDMKDLGTTTKSVKYSVLYMKAVKALQEAMARIETLEAKVTALENA